MLIGLYIDRTLKSWCDVHPRNHGKVDNIFNMALTMFKYSFASFKKGEFSGSTARRLQYILKRMLVRLLHQSCLICSCYASTSGSLFIFTIVRFPACTFLISRTSWIFCPRISRTDEVGLFPVCPPGNSGKVRLHKPKIWAGNGQTVNHPHRWCCVKDSGLWWRRISK